MGMLTREVDHMNLDSLVERGRLPWRPNDRACDLNVWHEYETPLVGTFDVEGRKVLFFMVLESEGGLSVWAYKVLTAEQAEKFARPRFRSISALRECVDFLFSGSEIVLTIARNDRIGRNYAVHTVESNLLDAVDWFLNGVIDTVREVPNVETRVLAKLAGVDAASVELVDA